MTTTTVIDRICPDEAHLSPSSRTWAREIYLPFGGPVLELRDPNSGQDHDPATKPRHQYLVEGERLWSRTLPPAPLDQLADETPWRDQAPAPPYWCLVSPAATRRGMFAEPNPTYLPWEWGLERGLPGPYPVEPLEVEVERDIHGNGGGACTAYIMPPADPWDMWPAITSYPHRPRACPVPGCEQHLVHYEAGYVPGYRVCMGLVRPDSFDPASLRHRFQLDHAGEFPGTVLILDA